MASIYRFAKTGKATKVNGDKVVYPLQSTVAALAAIESPEPGDQVYATNARKVGEAAATGTGKLVYWGGAAWLTVSDDIAPTV